MPSGVGFPSRVAVKALEVEVIVQLFDEDLEKDLRSVSAQLLRSIER